MIDKVTLNARRPKRDECGYKMLERMNKRHKSLSLWGLEHLSLDSAADILDVGCGGGQNIYRMAKTAPKAKVYGVDYSEASIEKSTQVNYDNISTGRVELRYGTAENLPYEKNSFDIVTAFETVYYWENIVSCFENVRGVLRGGGHFMVCNEDCSKDDIAETAEALDMHVYTADEIGGFMEQAGFVQIKKYCNPNGRWICVVGKKAAD